MVQYLAYLWPSMTTGQGDVLGLGLVALLVLMLWRRVENIGKLTVGMWAVMIVCVCAVILAAFTHFNGPQAFTWPAGAISLTHGSFWIGFASGLTVGIFDYLGYNTTAYLGAEIKQPGRVMPRSIIVSIIAIGTIYLVMQIGVLGVVPWHDMLATGSIDNSSIAAAVLQQTWGKGAAQVVAVLVVITAFASVFTGLLGGSRVPFDAARDGMFFRSFGRLHRKHEFPTIGLLVMGVMTALAFLFARHIGDSAAHPPLTVLISLLTTVMVIVQSLAQIAAVSVLRRRQPHLARPYKMILYPLPSVVAGIGWLTIYLFADKANAGVHPIEWSLAWLALGCLAFLVWARREHSWPFGPKEIREEFLEQQEAAQPEPVG
jgi:amino acid transporter